MFGWESRATIVASRLNLPTNSASSASGAPSTLIATGRPSSRVLGQVDGGHPTVAERALDRVATLRKGLSPCHCPSRPCPPRGPCLCRRPSSHRLDPLRRLWSAAAGPASRRGFRRRLPGAVDGARRELDLRRWPARPRRRASPRRFARRPRRRPRAWRRRGSPGPRARSRRGQRSSARPRLGSHRRRRLAPGRYMPSSRRAASVSGRPALANLLLRALDWIRDTVEGCPARVQVKRKPGGARVAVSRLADRSRVQEPAPFDEVDLRAGRGVVALAPVPRRG